MGSVGINFGAAASGSGFDVTTTVASIVGNLKAVETPWTTQLASLKSQDAAFTSIGTDLATLSTSLLALTDFQGVMASKLGSSSDENILSLGSAGPTATAGSHTIVVSQLAQTSSEYSATVPASDKLSGALTIQVGTDTPHVIPVVSSTSDTLASYAAAINLADIGVSASVISDTTGSRLSIVSKTSGLAGQLTVTSGGTTPATATDGVTTPAATYGALTDTTFSTAGTAVVMKSGLAGQNAKLTVDGLSIDNASNTVSTAIPGVNFQLLSSDPSIQVQVQIANDNTTVVSAFSSLVTAYNAVVKDIKTQEGNDSSGTAEPLFGNTVISQLQSALSLALTSGATSGSVNSLYQLGIAINQDGTLKLDTSALTSELNSNYSDVVGYLQNSKSFGLTFQNTLDQLGSQSPTGAVTLALAANSSQETVFNNDVTAQDALIATKQTGLTAQLNLANEILQAIPQQLNEVDQLYSAMTGYNTKS
jgi:flagellar hook-associated protein 2